MNRKFTAPFWFFLILGIMSSFAIYNVFDIQMKIYKLPWFRFWWLLLYPVVLFGEAIVYYIIRKRNKSRRDSWMHILLMTIAVLAPALFEIALSFANRDNYTVSTHRRFLLVRTVIFYGSLFTAHIFFVRVLIKTGSKTPEPETQPSENLLDEFAP
jgi:uncharacterized membrane protein YgdD (TMEM256/DUF423 family)